MIAASDDAEFARHTCTAPAARSDRMRDIVTAVAPVDRPIRVLDLGCGTGSLVVRLADTLPAATVIGLDVSPANITAAERSQARGPASNVQFVTGDYLSYRTDPFDVIVSDGVLHLIDADTASLAAKLARDLRRDGTLICNMPFACAYNTAFAIVRRGLRAIRAPWLDRTILQAARMLHGDTMDDDALRERVLYMYMPPRRVMGARLRRTFADAGLYRQTEYAMTATSPSQLRHRVTIFTRRDPGQ